MIVDCSATLIEKRNGLSSISLEAVGVPVRKYEERRADVCAYLCISTVRGETSYISRDDCFAAFVSCPRREWTLPPKDMRNYIKISGTPSIAKAAEYEKGGKG